MGITFENITAFLSILSWKKIIQFIIFILVIGIAYGAWDNRTAIYSSLKVGVKVETDSFVISKLSPTVVSLIDDSAEKTKYIVGGIQVLNVDFRKNTRSTVYFSFNDPGLKAAVDVYNKTKITDTPLFTESEMVNQKIIDLINGEFICYDFKNTLAYSVYPKAADTITTVCATSIPPYYGRFSGYMNVYLTHKPTDDDLTLIRQLSRDISLKIYTTDVNKTVKYRPF